MCTTVEDEMMRTLFAVYAAQRFQTVYKSRSPWSSLIRFYTAAVQASPREHAV